jgi:hypothetical protein
MASFNAVLVVQPMEVLLQSYLREAKTMDVTQADSVQQLVAMVFAELGVLEPKFISRSFLLRDMHYAGQVFRCEGWQAVWLTDGNSVEFFDAAGNRVRSVGLALVSVPDKTAKAA